MKFSRLVRLLVVAVLAVFLVIATSAQENPGAPVPNETLLGKPESAEGLKNFLQDVMASIKSGDKEKSSAAIASLAIPPNSDWFVKTFGPAEGARLESKKEELQNKPQEWLENRIEGCIEAGKMDVEIQGLHVSGDAFEALQQAVLLAMVAATPVYSAGAQRDSKDRARKFLGDFVYFDGGFHYIDRQIWEALSSTHPLRIRVGGDVAAARVVQRVDPEYSAEARDRRMEGTVVLHVIIGIDGKVRKVDSISGPPELIQAATNAVQQWIYQPTLLNDWPIEMDTQVAVVFSLR